MALQRNSSADNSACPGWWFCAIRIDDYPLWVAVESIYLRLTCIPNPLMAVWLLLVLAPQVRIGIGCYCPAVAMEFIEPPLLKFERCGSIERCEPFVESGFRFKVAVFP